jgi:hypothetical protein
VLGQLQQANSDLKELETVIVQNAGNPAFADAGRDILYARQRYNDAADQYTTAYRATFGEIPTGLSGLGQWMQAAGWAAVLTAVLAILAVVYQYIKSGRDKIQAARDQTSLQASVLQRAADLRTQSSAAAKRGDVTAARQLADQATQLESQVGAAAGAVGKPQDWSAWLQNNAVWIGLGLAGMLALPKLASKI